MSHNPRAGYGQPFTVGDGLAPDAPAKKSSMLGIIGLALVGIYLIAVIVALGFSPNIVVISLPPTSGSSGQLGAGAFSELGVLLLMMASGVMGLAGWIVGIVATVTKRGRAFGVVAIIIGLVAFLVASTMMFGMLLTTVG